MKNLKWEKSSSVGNFDEIYWLVAYYPGKTRVRILGIGKYVDGKYVLPEFIRPRNKKTLKLKPENGLKKAKSICEKWFAGFIKSLL